MGQGVGPAPRGSWGCPGHCCASICHPGVHSSANPCLPVQKRVPGTPPAATGTALSEMEGINEWGVRESRVPGWELVGICQGEGQCPPAGQGCATCGDGCRDMGRERGASLAARAHDPMARKVHASLLPASQGRQGEEGESSRL